MTIALDHDHDRFTTHTRAIASRAEAMSERRNAIEHEVERLLASWRGAAADRFEEAWQEWRDGADGVINGLAARTESLIATRDDLIAADALAEDAGSRLRGRLG